MSHMGKRRRDGGESSCLLHPDERTLISAFCTFARGRHQKSLSQTRRQFFSNIPQMFSPPKKLAVYKEARACSHGRLLAPALYLAGLPERSRAVGSGYGGITACLIARSDRHFNIRSE
jgi:hypothetical protein